MTLPKLAMARLELYDSATSMGLEFLQDREWWEYTRKWFAHHPDKDAFDLINDGEFGEFLKTLHLAKNLAETDLIDEAAV